MIFFLKWLLGPLTALILWICPLELNPQAHALAGLMVWIVLWWIFEPIPLAMTALFGAAMSVIIGVTSVKSAMAPFAHPLIFLFFGGYIIARSMAVHELDKRIALGILTQPFVAGKPMRTVISLLCICAFLSMWISNTATTAMLLPISLGVLGALLPKDPKGKGTALLAVAYSSSIGGTATSVGSTPNIIALGMLDELAGISFSFIEWMIYITPVSFVCLLFLIFLTNKRLPKLAQSSKENQRFLKDQFKSLGKMKTGEKNTLIAALCAVFLWVTPGVISLFLGKKHFICVWLKSHLPEPVGAIIAASLLFMLRLDDKKPTLTWKQAMHIDWGSLLLFGGGLSLGAQMFDTGLAQLLGQTLIDATGGSFWLFTFLSVLFAIFFTETTSNTATANMLIPLVIAAALDTGFSPVIPTIGVALACSLAFMLPVSTPPNAIVYGSGYIKIAQMIRNGITLNIACAIIVMGFLVILNQIIV